MKGVLTNKQEFCLRFFARGSGTAYQAAQAAFDAGANKTRSKLEWAHAPCRELRRLGLVERAGRLRTGQAEYKLTDAGRDMLARIEAFEEQGNEA